MWLYHLFNLSHRDVEDLKAQRGITISYEAIRLRCNKFGSKYAVADITNPDIIQKILDHIRAPPRSQPPPLSPATAIQS
jgi:hypothetical protein